MFVFIAIFFFIAGVLGPIGKGIGTRIARGGTPPKDTAKLHAVLERIDQRLAASEERLGSMEERLDFYEKLLADPERAPRLPGRK